MIQTKTVFEMEDLRVIRLEDDGFLVRYYVERQESDALGGVRWVEEAKIESNSRSSTDRLLRSLLFSQIMSGKTHEVGV